MMKALKDVALDAVFCSGLQRASNTADEIHRHHSTIPRIRGVRKIMEMNFGDLEGKALNPNSEAEKIWLEYRNKVENGQLDLKLTENGESQLSVYTRGIEGLLLDENSIYKHSKNKNFKHVAAVAHGRFNKVCFSIFFHRLI